MKRALPGITIMAMLVLPATLWLLGNRTATIENRALAEWPAANRSDVATAEYFREAEDAVIDRLPLRTVAVQYHSEALLRLLGESTSPKVVIGEDGFLFYTDAVEQRCAQPSVEEFVASTKRAENLMSHLGKELHILIAPDKAAVYHERLGIDSCASESAAAISRAAAQTAAVLYPYADLRLLAADSPPDDSPYYQWDTHWTTFGAATGSRAIVDSVRPSLWDDTSLTKSTNQSKQGDLATLLGITREESEPLYASARPGALTEESKVPNLTGIDGEALPDTDGRRYETELAGGNLIGRSSVVLHDSFGWNLNPTLTPYFERIDAYQYPKIDDASFPVIQEAQVLILVFVQRNWWDANNVAIDEALAAVLADELNPVPFVTESDGSDAATVIVAQMRCESNYLVIKRPNGTGPTVFVDGEQVEPVSQSATAAFWSAAGRWKIQISGVDKLPPIWVVDACSSFESSW